MTTKVKNWATGDGSVTLTYSGQGNGTIIVESDPNTLDVSRSMTLDVSTGSITRNVTVNQGACPVNFRTKDQCVIQASGGEYIDVKPLPYDAEVEYIGGTGTQYITLPIVFYKTDKIYTRFSVDTTQTSDKYMVAPITWNNNSNRFGMGVHNGGKYTCAYGSTSTGQTALSNLVNDGNLHDWAYSYYLFRVSDLYIQKDVSAINFGGATAYLRLFYGYNSVTKGFLSSYKHVRNDEVLIDLIAVRKNGVGYMYDRVSGTLYGNNGTGSFVIGSDKN